MWDDVLVSSISKCLLISTRRTKCSVLRNSIEMKLIYSGQHDGKDQRSQDAIMAFPGSQCSCDHIISKWFYKGLLWTSLNQRSTVHWVHRNLTSRKENDHDFFTRSKFCTKALWWRYMCSSLTYFPEGKAIYTYDSFFSFNNCSFSPFENGLNRTSPLPLLARCGRFAVNYPTFQYG